MPISRTWWSWTVFRIRFFQFDCVMYPPSLHAKISTVVILTYPWICIQIRGFPSTLYLFVDRFGDADLTAVDGSHPQTKNKRRLQYPDFLDGRVRLCRWFLLPRIPPSMWWILTLFPYTSKHLSPFPDHSLWRTTKPLAPPMVGSTWCDGP